GVLRLQELQRQHACYRPGLAGARTAGDEPELVQCTIDGGGALPPVSTFPEHPFGHLLGRGTIMFLAYTAITPPPRSRWLCGTATARVQAWAIKSQRAVVAGLAEQRR